MLHTSEENWKIDQVECVKDNKDDDTSLHKP